jgi:hypothetical protein
MPSIMKINWQNIREFPIFTQGAHARFLHLQENTMSSCTQIEESPTHAGVLRAGSILHRLAALRHGFDGGRGLAVMLLAAIVAPMLVVADRIMSYNEEGGLLVAWVALWLVAFVGLALFAGTARRLTLRAWASLREGAERRAAARLDDELLSVARHDARVLGELRAIASRREFAH